MAKKENTPMKVYFFVSEAVWRRILTVNNEEKEESCG